MVYGGLQSGKNGNLLFFLKKYIKKFLYCFGYILKLVYLLIYAIVLDVVEEGMIFCFSGYNEILYGSCFKDYDYKEC